jgi:hypothetical protein
MTLAPWALQEIALDGTGIPQRCQETSGGGPLTRRLAMTTLLIVAGILVVARAG